RLEKRSARPSRWIWKRQASFVRGAPTGSATPHECGAFSTENCGDRRPHAPFQPSRLLRYSGPPRLRANARKGTAMACLRRADWVVCTGLVAACGCSSGQSEAVSGAMGAGSSPRVIHVFSSGHGGAGGSSELGGAGGSGGDASTSSSSSAGGGVDV